jgi:hypothetical protein
VARIGCAVGLSGLAAVEQQIVGEHPDDETALVDRVVSTFFFRPCEAVHLSSLCLRRWRFSRVGGLGAWISAARPPGRR